MSFGIAYTLYLLGVYSMKKFELQHGGYNMVQFSYWVTKKHDNNISILFIPNTAVHMNLLKSVA